LFGGIERNHGTCIRRERGGDHARSAGHIEQLAFAGLAERGGEAVRVVGFGRQIVEILRLSRELVGNELEMIHMASLSPPSLSRF
jgi:hypothetical protein